MRTVTTVTDLKNGAQCSSVYASDVIGCLKVPVTGTKGAHKALGTAIVEVGAPEAGQHPCTVNISCVATLHMPDSKTSVRVG
jgi:hypothetical protein